MSNNARVTGIVLSIIGIALGLLLLNNSTTFGLARVRVIEGYAFPNGDSTAIGFGEQQEGQGEGYIIAGAPWRDQGGPWTNGGTSCLEPLTEGQKVRLGVVRVASYGEAPGRTVVVWYECLG